MRIEILSDFIGLTRVLKKGEVKCPPPGNFFARFDGVRGHESRFVKIPKASA